MIKKSLGINSTKPTSTSATTHAEMDAMQKYNRIRNKPTKVDVIVLRYTKDGFLSESRPCRNCLIRLSKSSEKFGYTIVNCYYSTRERTVTREKFSEMLFSDKTQVSTGFRKPLGYWRDNKENYNVVHTNPHFDKPKVTYVKKKKLSTLSIKKN